MRPLQAVQDQRCATAFAGDGHRPQSKHCPARFPFPHNTVYLNSIVRHLHPLSVQRTSARGRGEDASSSRMALLWGCWSKLPARRSTPLSQPNRRNRGDSFRRLCTGEEDQTRWPSHRGHATTQLQRLLEAGLVVSSRKPGPAAPARRSNNRRALRSHSGCCRAGQRYRPGMHARRVPFDAACLIATIPP